MVFKLSAIFSLDSFGGGFVLQSIMAYWLFIRFGVTPAALGVIFFASNLLNGFSALAAAALAKRIGLIRTMVFTHIPANLFLILAALSPYLPMTVLFLLLRSCLSSMDVPARQSYTMAVVKPDERSATAGITSVVRQLGAAFAQGPASLLLGSSAGLFIAGGVKIVYDLSLFYVFKDVKPPEENGK